VRSFIAIQAEQLRAALRRDGCLTLGIKVTPRARTGEVFGLMADGALKVKVTAVPEKGRANEEVCAVLADFLNVPKRTVAVILGHASQKKRVRIVA